MDARFRMKILKLKHGFEAERQKIRMDKDLYIEKIAKKMKDFQHAINQLNGKIRTMKQWLAK